MDAPHFVYLLRCVDNSIYVGMTNDVPRRAAEHQEGLIPGCFTHDRRPVELIWSQEFPTQTEAFRFERQVKKWSRAKKDALSRGDWQELHMLAKRRRRSGA